MPPITPSQIVALQRNSDHIRNICILAHVDHGKTSLSDCLLSTNGIISAKLAGRVRYLDSRPDEQLRGITMESSAISLYFRMMRRSTIPDAEPELHEYLVNLIDSPGHIDFSSEVSTASRLCDGAVVLVDAVEGVCSQTVTVLRQAWVENIKPILVINKIDRLITELQLTPLEAFERMGRTVEQVNAVMGSFFAGERMEEDLKWRETLEKRVAEKAAAKKGDTTDATEDAVDEQFQEKDDEEIYFAPEKHNVIFASAIDGWAFTIRQFADIYEKKLGVKKEQLEKFLWGKYYLDPKTKRVLSEKHLKGRKLRPMFVTLVLESIWAIYNSTVLNHDQEKIEKIVKSLNLKILPRDLKSKDLRSLLQTIFMQWLPLSKAVLISVVEQLPPPTTAQKDRMPHIIDSVPGKECVSEDIKTAVTEFSTKDDSPVVAYVSKMISIPAKELKKVRRVQLTAEEMRELRRKKTIEDARRLQAKEAGIVTAEPEDSEDEEGNEKKEQEEEDDSEKLIGFARVYSGTIKTGQELYVLGPKYNPAYPDQHIQKVTVKDLYYMMGRDLEALNEVPAGNVFAIAGLEGKILKNGTLVSVPTGGLNLAGIRLGSAPIVRVALEPRNPSQMQQLVEGCKLLEQADPCAEYVVQDNGEHVILTAGELHLERCLKDLRERYAKIEIQSSPPIVPFRETIVSAAEMSPPKDPNLPRGTVVAVTPSGRVSVRIRTRPLPAKVTQFLVQNMASIKNLYSSKRAGEAGEAVAAEVAAVADDERGTQANLKLLSMDEIKAGLTKAFSKCPPKERDIWQGVVDKIIAFGPRRVGPNLLIDATEKSLFRKLLLAADEEEKQKQNATEDNENNENLIALSSRDFEDKITHAFQLTTSSGPLCNEPIQGIACILESLELTNTSSTTDLSSTLTKSFELIPAIQNAIKTGFLDWSPRLLLAMYSCDIQASTEVLGRVHDTISQRGGRTISEDQEEGTPFWTIRSLIPVAESFGFATEILKNSRGAATPQLVFYGFEILDVDPFWIPFTEEELEDLGDTADRENVAKRYMDAVRERKGLYVQKRLVVGANKQKTLKR
ncbi:putative ribosome biogenesis protein Ria1 [Pyronema omphalodes]|nr:putative ribosome biogenesis protein Ria1 [Pyronema omphalodes]